MAIDPDVQIELEGIEALIERLKQRIAAMEEKFPVAHPISEAELSGILQRLTALEVPAPPVTHPISEAQVAEILQRLAVLEAPEPTPEPEPEPEPEPNPVIGVEIVVKSLTETTITADAVPATPVAEVHFDLNGRVERTAPYTLGVNGGAVPHNKAPGENLVLTATAFDSTGTLVGFGSATVTVPRPSTAPPPTTPTTNRRYVIPAGTEILVTEPQGALEPITSDSISATDAGVASWDGDYWQVSRDWDESVEGAHLYFDGAIDWNGHTLIGVHQELVKPPTAGVKTCNVGGGIGKQFLFTNPQSHSISDVFNHGSFHLQGFTLLGVDGDAIRPPGPSTWRDGHVRIETKKYTSADGKHFDGFQHHNSGNSPTGQNRSDCTVERVVLEMFLWNPSEPPLSDGYNMNVAGGTGVIFLQSDNWGHFSDVIVNAPGVWYPVRFVSRTNKGSASRLQLIGDRGHPRDRPDKLAPTHFVMYTSEWEGNIDWDSVHVSVPGVNQKKLT